MATIIFPKHHLNGGVDESFIQEAEVARELGFHVTAVDIDSLAEVKLSPPEGGGLSFYRGWMLTGEEYHQLERLAKSSGHKLATSSKQYVLAHHMEGWLSILRGLTPPTVIVPADSSESATLEATGDLIAPNGYFVKHSTKSEPGFNFAESRMGLPELIADLHGAWTGSRSESIAIRRFVLLDDHYAEMRLWFADGKLVHSTVHPDELRRATPRTVADRLPLFVDIASKRLTQAGLGFFVVDIARTVDGGWTIIEVGDGQVSGIGGDGSEARKIFTALKELDG